METKKDKAIEIEIPPEPIISDPLIENAKPLHKITKEQGNKIKDKNKKTQIVTIYAKEPIQTIPLSVEKAEKIKKLKEKNKKKPAPVYL